MEVVLLINTIVIVVAAWIFLGALLAGLWAYAKWLSKE